MTDPLPSLADVLGPPPLSDDELDADPGENPLVELARDRWSITDLGSAAWSMGKYADAANRMGVIRAQAEAWRAKIDAWEQHEVSPLKNRLAIFEDHLTLYAAGRREADPKAKSLVLPNGKVQTTEHKASVKIVDPEAVVLWAGDREELVEVKVVPVAAAVKSVIDFKVVDGEFFAVDTTTGEVVERQSGPSQHGLEIVPPRLTYSVRPS